MTLIAKRKYSESIIAAGEVFHLNNEKTNKFSWKFIFTKQFSRNFSKYFSEIIKLLLF